VFGSRILDINSVAHTDGETRETVLLCRESV
jgi:hypothetical protein